MTRPDLPCSGGTAVEVDVEGPRGGICWCHIRTVRGVGFCVGA
jgi:hypothetical protein